MQKQIENQHIDINCRSRYLNFLALQLNVNFRCELSARDAGNSTKLIATLLLREQEEMFYIEALVNIQHCSVLPWNIASETFNYKYLFALKLTPCRHMNSWNWFQSYYSAVFNNSSFNHTIPCLRAAICRCSPLPKNVWFTQMLIES